ncbi:MarR family winged helix-turn-helix transcriptional regulator [Novosphingobium sp. P6W]|uniref:MarR family winged helix-turn-helix transcriptional regulator n=1 Tax=Novosphingobium sp. P6W TaxID=1609758 RepID=UPI000B17C93A|nr:MarR family transcriptional regulator [Novosphingobium sp. P6W]AXB76909.1 MarR family transcriptional regulator [Novosphingobium sp. P6W]
MATEAEDKPMGKLSDPFSMRDESPTRQVGLRMTIVSRLQRNNFDRKVAALNVTRSQWAMIAIVARYPGSTQRTIAEYLEMSEASAGRLIDRLCADELLERRDRKDDRRARAVYLTEQAKPLLDQLGAIASESEKRMFAGFSDEEVDRLLNYMTRIYENVSRG